MLKLEAPILFLFILFSSISVESQILLKNEANLLPLAQLDKFHLEISEQANSVLFTVREYANYYKEEHVPTRLSTQEKVQLFLVRNQLELDRAKQSVQGKVIVCFFDFAPRKLDWADAIISITKSKDKIIDMVQSMFGGIGFSELLSEDSGDFSSGEGLKTEGALRLRFLNQEESVYYQPLQDTLNQIIQQGLDSLAIPGAQLLVLHEGKVVVMKEYGCQTFEGCVPVEQKDLYDMASITKVSTATPALMYLYDQKKIDLDRNLCYYFPILCNSDKSNIPLREALAHQGRLMPYIVYYQNTYRKNGKFKGRTFKPDWSERFPIKITDSLYLHRKYKKQIDKAIRKSPLNVEPGYVYSGLTFLLYPELVKRLSGERIDSFMYNHFYDRLGASRLTYRPLDRFALDEIFPTDIDTVFRHQLVHGYVNDEASAMLDGLS